MSARGDSMLPLSDPLLEFAQAIERRRRARGPADGDGLLLTLLPSALFDRLLREVTALARAIELEDPIAAASAAVDVGAILALVHEKSRRGIALRRSVPDMEVGDGGKS